MKQKLNNLRTVALRIVPALAVVFTIVLSLILPAAAVGYNYRDHLINETDFASSIFSSFELPTTTSSWSLFGYPSRDFIMANGNPSIFLLDKSQLFSDHSYVLECFVADLDLSNIPDGSVLSGYFCLESSIRDDEFSFGRASLLFLYMSANGTIVNSDEYQLQVSDISNIEFNDVVINKDSDSGEPVYMKVYVIFEGFELYESVAGSTVGFGISSVRFDLYQYRSSNSIYLYDGQSYVTTFEDVVFPCMVDITSDGFTITNAGSNSPNYTYTISDDRTFYGLKKNSIDSSEFFPIGSSIQFKNPDSLFLLLNTEVGGVSIFNYTGSYLIEDLTDIVLPCRVHVGLDGLYFTYAGSDEVDFFFSYEDAENVIGVSLVMCDSFNKNPIGSTFTLTSPRDLYIICDGDLPELRPPGSSDGSIDGFLDINSSEVNNFFVDLMVRLDIPYANVLAMFWQSSLLHDLLLMAALFALFSFILFGKKG